MRFNGMLAAAVVLTVGCSWGETNETSAAPDAAPGAGASGGSAGDAGKSGSGGTAGGDGASGADAALGFDCDHVQVVEDCQNGWCRIPAGCFVMGSPADEWGRGAYDENQVKVTLTHSFVIQEKETKQAEWTALGLKNPSTLPNKPGNSGDCLDPSCPVGNVTWFEAAAFANLWPQKEGLTPCYELGGCVGELNISRRTWNQAAIGSRNRRT